MPFFVNGEQIYDKEVAEFSNILVFAAFGLEFFIITFFFPGCILEGFTSFAGISLFLCETLLLKCWFDDYLELINLDISLFVLTYDFSLEFCSRCFFRSLTLAEYSSFMWFIVWFFISLLFYGILLRSDRLPAPFLSIWWKLWIFLSVLFLMKSIDNLVSKSPYWSEYTSLWYLSLDFYLWDRALDYLSMLWLISLISLISDRSFFISSIMKTM